MMKNTFNIFKKAAVLFAVALGLNSCLEKIPGDYILEEDTMNTVADAEQILTGIEILSVYYEIFLFSTCGCRNSLCFTVTEETEYPYSLSAYCIH